MFWFANVTEGDRFNIYSFLLKPLLYYFWSHCCEMQRKEKLIRNQEALLSVSSHLFFTSLYYTHLNSGKTTVTPVFTHTAHHLSVSLHNSCPSHSSSLQLSTMPNILPRLAKQQHTTEVLPVSRQEFSPCLGEKSPINWPIYYGQPPRPVFSSPSQVCSSRNNTLAAATLSRARPGCGF